MCLTVKKDSGFNYIKDCKFYKILLVKDGKLVAPYIESYEYKPGVNRSNGELNIENCAYESYVHGGAIHVYTDFSVAVKNMLGLSMWSNENKYVIAKVGCEEKDLVAVGRFNEAAFYQVNLTQEEYDRALNVYN